MPPVITARYVWTADEFMRGVRYHRRRWDERVWRYGAMFVAGTLLFTLTSVFALGLGRELGPYLPMALIPLTASLGGVLLPN
ncbi:MAG TPA: hypothetical protein VK610_03300 [Rhodothermales bacterium]|nr:hypothetical protein [Rhodothermales bacterium]